MSKALLLLNGQPPSREILPETDGVFVACADGACNWVQKYNIMPDIILGDMDSDCTECFQSVPRLRFSCEKDDTDGEIALRYLAEHGYGKIDIYGAAGRREDHMLANYGLLALAARLKVAARIVTEYTDAYFAEREFSLRLKEGTLLSVVPFGGDAHIMMTEGLKYRVEDKTLRVFGSLGISNVVTEPEVKISFSKGNALIFVVKKID